MAFTIRQYDLSPSIRATLLDADGQVINLTGASVTLKLKLAGSTVVIERTMTVANAVQGIVQYDWVSGDTDVAGTYLINFKVIYDDGSPETFPNNDNQVLNIVPSL